MEKLQSLIKEVLEITYGKYGAQYRKQLIETNSEQYYILRASGELYKQIKLKDLELERENIT